MKSWLPSYGILFGLISFTSCSSAAQENKIDTYINSLLTQKKFAGAAIAVLKNNTVIFNKNYGLANLKNNIEITNGTTFNIMSITKNFIAFAIMQLADENLISLDEPVTKYLNDLPSQYNNVLIYQLLNHSSGVPDYVHVKGYMAQANQTQTPMEVLKPILSEPLRFNPGEKNEYSNSGYFLLGVLIEKVTGKKLSDYLKENVFQPAEMNDTYLEKDITQSKSKAKGYTNFNGELKEEINLNPSQYWAAGGIVSTKDDMIKWDKALTTGTILSKKEINQMMQPSKLSNGNEGDYGFGFELMNTPSMKVAGNNGAGLGYNASNLIFLNDGLTVIVLTNTSNSNSTMIAKNIRDLIVGEIGNRSDTNEAQIKRDRLDSLVIQVLNDAKTSIVNQIHFNDDEAALKFKSEAAGFIQSQGKLLTIQMQGEKVNPQSIVRRYEVDFEKRKTMFVIIFSKQGRIMLVNHM